MRMIGRHQRANHPDKMEMGVAKSKQRDFPTTLYSCAQKNTDSGKIRHRRLTIFIYFSSAHFGDNKFLKNYLI